MLTHHTVFWKALSKRPLESKGQCSPTVLRTPNYRIDDPSFIVLTETKFSVAQIALRKQDLDPFRDAVNAFREQGCNVHLRDHRGNDFGGIAYPLTHHLRADVPEYPSEAGAIVHDAIVDDILAATVRKTICKN